MNDEQLLRLIEQDRRAPLPEQPDPRWIAARVRTKLPPPEPELAANAALLLSLWVLGALVPTAWALLSGHAAWLLLWPALLLLNAPLLWKKGANPS